jgi:zona occludens toxin
MPLIAYIGIPRAGKSYEVVSKVILPALRQGRRVISNIDGLNPEAFKSILFAEGFAEDKIGELITIAHDEVSKELFWRTDFDSKDGTETFLQPGDLLALDEVWRFWKKRGDINPRAMNFFRMHGHFSHPVTGLTCEVALITQSIRDINENIREVIQETYQMVKNTKLGSNKSYIVHIFQRGSTNKTDFIRTLPPRFYSPEFFPLYKSHSTKAGDADAQEKNPDSRSSIFQGALFKIGLPLALCLSVYGFYSTYKFLNPKPVTPSASAGASLPPVVAIPAPPPVPVISNEWKVTGYFLKNGMYTFLIVNVYGTIRQLVNPPNFQFQGSGVSVELPEGGFATTWANLNQSKSPI